MKKITRKYLQTIGIVDAGRDAIVRRCKTRSGGVVESVIYPRLNNGSPAVALSVNGKTVYFSLARFVYAWRYGEIGESDEAVFTDSGDVVKCTPSEARNMRRRR